MKGSVAKVRRRRSAVMGGAKGWSGRWIALKALALA
jgi:hypothetical protein